MPDFFSELDSRITTQAPFFCPETYVEYKTLAVPSRSTAQLRLRLCLTCPSEAGHCGSTDASLSSVAEHSIGTPRVCSSVAEHSISAGRRLPEERQRPQRSGKLFPVRERSRALL